jgi:hypothetical protein
MPIAAALAVGVVVQAGTPGQAGAQTPHTVDEVALAQPRLYVPDRGAVALPHPLSTADAERLRRAFAAQQEGAFDQAMTLQAAVTNPLLIPSLLADRYFRWPDRVSQGELQDWLSHNADLPDAPAIRALLQAQLPRGATLPPLAASPLVWNEEDPEEAPTAEQPGNPAAGRGVRDQLRRGRPDLAAGLLDHSRGVPARQAAELRGEIAQALLASGDDRGALKLAQRAWMQCGGSVALPAFIAGLAQWRLVQPDLAARWFEAASRAAVASPAGRSAASYWAARAHLRNGDHAAWAPWMRRAAAEPRSFYGLLARRALGLGIGFSADTETLSEADVEAVSGTQGGLRAFALLQAGQPERAEAELRLLWPLVRSNPAFGRSLLLVARAAGLQGLAAQLASLEQMHDGMLRDDARYPLPALAPRGGFLLDPALVYGLARVESNFDSMAVSNAGARGLMQVTPSTADFIAGNDGGRAAGQLHEPAYNLQLGQRYLLYLARLDGVGADLIHVLASYNAGPGTLLRWTGEQVAADDPLLFLETIPYPETRRFVRRVLTASWVYAARLHRPAPSLDELAGGAWPGFNTPARHVPTEVAKLN